MGESYEKMPLNGWPCIHCELLPFDDNNTNCFVEFSSSEILQWFLCQIFSFSFLCFSLSFSLFLSVSSVTSLLVRASNIEICRFDDSWSRSKITYQHAHIDSAGEYHSGGWLGAIMMKPEMPRYFRWMNRFKSIFIRWFFANTEITFLFFSFCSCR